MHPYVNSVEELPTGEPYSISRAPLDVSHHVLANFVFRVEHELPELIVPGIHQHHEIVFREMIGQSKYFVHTVEHVVLVAHQHKFSIVEGNHTS
jgi:hypothetical protein